MIPKHLVDKVKSIPSKPGIYKMKDKDGNIIYIGKSKTLNTRVKSYFYGHHEFNKIERMVFNINDIDYIVTDTHLEAQILECVLIKKLQPIYNSQFKNDRKYKYLKVENKYKNKPLIVVDEREDENSFGPYRSKGKLIEIIKSFENIFPISKCESSYKFTYNILPKSMNMDMFKQNRDCLIEIFTKKECMLEFISQIEKKMNLASSQFKFETASFYRDMYNYMRYIYKRLENQFNDLKSKKILIGEKIENGFKIFYISNHKIIYKKKYQIVTRKDIKEFLRRAKELEDNLLKIKNEKRDLDFSTIIKAEIQDESTKSVLFLGDDYDLDKFIQKLTQKPELENL